MSQYTRYPDPAGGIKIYPSAVNFPPSAQDGAQAVAADTNTIYVYDTSVPGWQPVANPGAAIAIDALQGDVSATGPGVVNATVNSVGGETAVDIAQSVQDTQAATNAATPGTIAKRDLNSEITLKGLNLDGSLAGTINIYPAATTTNYSVTLPAAQGAASSVLQNDGLGGLSWVNLVTGVSAVTASAPLSSSGGATPDISISQSSAVSDGYLSSADFTTFNNAASTVASATDLSTPSTLVKRDASAKTALKGLKLDGSTSGTLSIDPPAAITSYSVVMPSAQGAASTFLQNDGSGNLSWTAVPSPYPAFSDDKVLYSTASAAEWRTVGLGSTSAAYPANTVILGTAKPASLTGTKNTFIGVGAASGMTGMTDSVVIGYNANASVNANKVIAIGSGATTNSGSGDTIAIGYNASVGPSGIGIGNNVSTGSSNDSFFAIGHNAFAATSATALGNSASAGSFTVVVGASSTSTGQWSTLCGNSSYIGSGGYGTVLGTITGSASASGTYNTLIGYQTARGLSTGSRNTIISTYAAAPGAGTHALTTGSDNTVVGADAAIALSTASGNVIIGKSAAPALTTAGSNVIIGYSAATALTTASNPPANNSGGVIAIGPDALDAMTTSGATTIAIGTQAFKSATLSEEHYGNGKYAGIAIGFQSAYLATTVTNSISIGGRANRGSGNISGCIAIGSSAGNLGNANIAMGQETLLAVTGNYNVVIGSASAVAITSGIGNVGLGYVSLREQVAGSVAITTGSYNTGLGYGASTSSATATGAISLGAKAVAGSNEFAVGSAEYQINTMLLGQGGAAQTSANAVKIMTARASGSADTSMTAGTLTLGGSQGTGTGAGGDVIIATAPAAGSTGSTTNAHVERIRVKSATEVVVNDTGVDFDFRVEGDTDANLLFVDAGNDKVGVGTASPAEKLDVNGGFKFAGGLTVKSIHNQTGTADVITVSVSDYYIGINSSGATVGITVNLPAAATAGAGKQYVFKDENGSAATKPITIDPNGAELIDGSSTYVMAVNRESVTIVCDGTGWQII